MQIFISAIGTDSGKTIVSSIFTEALNADYWKPIQAGFPRDTETVRQLVSNRESRFYSEAYLLGHPMSPHAAAELDEVKLNIGTFQAPETNRHLVIEGAGGLMVPLNEHDLVIDLIAKWNVPLVLVSNLYLGSINHSLLSLEAIKRRNLNLLGIVFNGEANPSSESIILQYAQCPCLLRIPQLAQIDESVIQPYAIELKVTLKKLAIIE